MAPRLDIPSSTSTVSVSLVDSTAQVHVPAVLFFEPTIAGHETFEACCFAFLVEHRDAVSGRVRRLVFDLAVRRDWATGFSPALLQNIGTIQQRAKAAHVTALIQADKDVRDVLAEGGVDTDTIEAIVWSHTHMDHIGNPATFGPTTALIVGPGFGKKGCCGGEAGAPPHLFPGFPADPESLLLEADYAGRELRTLSEADFTLTIGGLRALDYFGDGSFYLVETPGHSYGHLSGLARVSADPSLPNGGDFVFMAGDAFHHQGEMRPSQYLPLPASLSSAVSAVVPGHSPTRPFYVPAVHGSHLDPAAVLDTIHKLQAFDADEHILMVAAHDSHLMDMLRAEDGLFPQTANDFYAKQWTSRSRWTFLQALGVEGYV